MELEAEKYLGEKIGEGYTRTVYAHLQDPSLVVKVHKPGARRRNNALEWQIWNRYKDEKFSKYLCPCVAFPHPDYLIMTRCDSVHVDDAVYKDLIHKMQDLGLEDLKAKNCGLYQRRCVIIDYGHPSFNRLCNKLS